MMFIYLVLFVNARSIINKMDELGSYVYTLKSDLMITESWAREDISDAELSTDDFVIFRNDGKIYVGGGCILYIRNCYYATFVEDLTNVPDTETVWCKLILSTVNFDRRLLLLLLLPEKCSFKSLKINAQH